MKIAKLMKKKEGKIEVKKEKIATQSDEKRNKGIGWNFSLASHGMRLHHPIPAASEYAGQFQWQMLKKTALFAIARKCVFKVKEFEFPNYTKGCNTNSSLLFLLPWFTRESAWSCSSIPSSRSQMKHKLSNKLRLINWKAEIHGRGGLLKQQCSVLSAYWNLQSNWLIFVWRRLEGKEVHEELILRTEGECRPENRQKPVWVQNRSSRW